MPRHDATSTLALVLLAALAGGCVISQDARQDAWQLPAADAEPPAPQPFATPTTPGPEHRVLDALVGRWAQSARIWTVPGEEPAETTGTVEYRWILDGRFLEGVFTGEVMGQPFEGRDITGYDRMRGEYFNVWVDNMSTEMMLSRGRYESATRSIIMTGTADDPMTGRRDQPFRSVLRVLADDETVFRVYSPGPGGEETKTLEVSALRLRD
ncbi:MAG: DUF1579 domain-containing protein [Planctomycetota bacterium]